MKNPNVHRMIATACLALALAACQSEVDNKTAATVSEPPSAPATPIAPGRLATEVLVSRETSRIEFVGAKVTRDHNGGFSEFTGSVAWIDGKPSSVSFDIGMNSIFTDAPKLTAHLKTADFFDVETFPTANFRSTSIIDAGADSKPGVTHIINGTLTMKGVEKAISFPVTVTSDAKGHEAKAEFTINRQEWGVAYKGMPDDLVKNEVLIKLDMHFPPAPAAPAPPSATATQG